MVKTSLIAVDLGASSGRVSLGIIEGARVLVEEVRRFPTPSFESASGRHWDVAALVAEITSGLRSAVDAGANPASVGIDSWGVDYGLLDGDGAIITAPFTHRDRRTAGVSATLDQSFLFDRTGVLCQDINTLTQLLSEDEQSLARARTLLFMPDLLAYQLSGAAATDPTIASTSQLLDPAGRVAVDVLTRYGIPNLLPVLAAPGTVLGEPLRDVTHAAGFRGVITTIAGHDTASAVAAIPASESPVAFISCGTWGLVGLELDRPILTPAALAAGFTNEIGYGSHHLLRNASGLWLLNECIREWGGSTMVDAPVLTAAAASLPAFVQIIDPLDPTFIPSGGMVERIAAYCAAHGQPVPRSRAEVVRCILDSLALGFANAISDAATVAGVQPDVVHIVGGGSRIPLLCATVASLTGKRVIAGPAEAATLGNLLIQAKALSLLEGATSMRDVVATSVSTETYLPEQLNGSSSAKRAYHDLVAVRGNTA